MDEKIVIDKKEKAVFTILTKEEVEEIGRAHV